MANVKEFSKVRQRSHVQIYGNWYRQFVGHKNREIKSLKIDFFIILVDLGSFRSFIHVRLTIQRIGVSPLLDKKLFIYLMQNLVRLPI